MTYNTKLLKNDDDGIAQAAALIKSGGIVGMPTETVYGLAANALDKDAVAKIFSAKGRPQDNPLIIHISSIEQMELYAHDIPDIAYKIAEAFWSGPLTMVLPKKDIIPIETSGGLDTVGIRFPSNKTAQRLITACGVPLAAPSANLSGSPSPTTAQHVYNDLNGRIPAIIDDGQSAVGVESTVISFENETVRILRPGFVTPEELHEVAHEVFSDRGVTEKLSDSDKVRSPGMKYKHYSPKADVIIVEGSFDAFSEYVSQHGGSNVYSLVFDSDGETVNTTRMTYGDSSEQQAHMLFSRLRELDDVGAKRVYVRCPDKFGVGLAVYNRLLRAAAFKTVRL